MTRRVLSLLFVAMMVPVAVWPQGGMVPADTAGSITEEDPLRPIEDLVGDEGEMAAAEYAAWLLEHPLDLNAATEDELVRIPGVHAADAASILRLRSRARGFSRLEQLWNLGTGGPRLASLIAPYVRIVPGPRSGLKVRSRLTRVLPAPTAAREAGGIGPDLREYHRIEGAPGETVWGRFVVKRDPGELMRDAFFSGTIVVRDLPLVDELVAGDMTGSGGLGLVFGRGGGAGGRTPVRGPEQSLHLEPYHGAGGLRFLRGFGVTRALRFGSGVLDAGALAARTPLAATLDEQGEISSLEAESAFTTEAARVRRNAVHEWAVGGRLAWRSAAGFTLGGSFLATRLSAPRAPGAVPAGPSRRDASALDASWHADGLGLSVECALSGSDLALAAHLSLAVVPAVRMSAGVWHCDPAYLVTKSGSTPGGGDPRNEQGAHFTWEVRPFRSFTIAGSMGFFRKLWRTTFDRMPPSGATLELGWEWKPAARLNIAGRVAVTERESWVADGGGGVLPGGSMLSIRRRSARVTITMDVTRDVRIRSRVEHVGLTGSGPGAGEHGWLMLQDMHWSAGRGAGIDLRLALVRTSSYASRLYALEHDVAGSVSAAPLYGTRLQWYVVGRCMLLPGIELSAKWATTTPVHGALPGTPVRTVTLQVDMVHGLPAD